jgi:hypothetical protein
MVPLAGSANMNGSVSNATTGGGTVAELALPGDVVAF